MVTTQSLHPEISQMPPRGGAVRPRTTALGVTKHFLVTGLCLPVEGGRADGKTEVQRENVMPSSWGVSNREGTLNR